jgi:hypothetical protein
MPAQIARLSLYSSINDFHCSVCGERLIDRENGLTDELCGHVVAVVDWNEELIVGPAATPKLSEAMNEKEHTAEALTKILPDTVIVFDFIEPPRGGGHGGSSMTIALDFAGSGDEEVNSQNHATTP